MEAGAVHMVLTRGQTGLTITPFGLLLGDVDIWAGSGKCGFHNTAAECRGGYQATWTELMRGLLLYMQKTATHSRSQAHKQNTVTQMRCPRLRAKEIICLIKREGTK